MKYKPIFKFKNKGKVIFLFIFSVLLSQVIFAQSTQLSLVDIFTALRSKKATLPEKNQILAEGVKQRGITFALNESLEEELRNAGADEVLINEIRVKSPKPEPKPTPQVESTPKPTPRPPDFSFYQNRGNSKFVMGEFDAAIADYNKAIELNSNEASIYFSRGIAFYNSKKFGLAVEDFDKVIELTPEESMAFYNRGNALEKLGETEKALNDFQKAFELDSENELANNAVQRLQASMPKPTSTANNTQETKEISQPKDNENKESNEPVFVDSLQNMAMKLIIPRYPSLELQRRIEGVVTVQITIDEKGKVISAKAINGPGTLRQVSEDAARRTKFNPYLVDNKPVQATGLINYNFKVPE